MYLIISGKRYQLDCLDSNLDERFKDLYSAWLGSGSINYDVFTKSAKLFLNLNTTNWDKHDKYFENYTLIWHKLMSEGKYVEAEELWKLSLQPIIEWESENKPKLIHKGTAYYFLGVTTIVKGEIDKGYSFMHQALEEDVRMQKSDLPHSPAFYFVSLNYQQSHQYFRNWLILQINFLNKFINIYREKYHSQLNVDVFRRKYLEEPPNRSMLFLFSYTLASFMLLHDIPDYAIKNNFSGQLELNLLFDLTLVIDGSIKHMNPSKWKFIDHASYLNNKRKLGMNKQRLSSINQLFNSDFDNTLNNLLDGKCKIDRYNIFGLGKDLAITYGIRNRGAHDVSSTPIMWRRFYEIEESIFNVLFWVVEDLYD